MTTIVTRAAKGSPLSWVEADANFTNLNTDKLEVSVIADYETSAHAASTYLPITTAASTYLTQTDASTLYRTKASLSANTGSTLVGFKSPETSSVARTVQAKLQERVSVLDFGAVGDGDADDTASFVNALASIPYGGTLHIPSGNYKLTDELVLQAGVTIIGEGAADNKYGAPPAYASSPTYLWQATPGKSIFLIGGGLSSITIKNLAMGAAKVPVAEMAPVTDGRYGIKCEGSYPQHSWMLRFEDLLFYNLERGLSIVDPYAQTNPAPHTYDWNCCPILMTSCRFLYPKYGIYIDTNNCDFCTFIGCGFSVPSNGAGVYLKATGYLRFINCAGGGASVSNNVFFHIEADGVGSMDNITLEGCQAETLTQFIRMSQTGSNIYRFMLTCRDCIAEMGADVYLAGNVHFISEGCRWLIGIYVDSANVRISSYDDYFGPGNAFWMLNGIEQSDAFINFRAGPSAPSGLSGIIYDNGYSVIRSTAPPVAGKHKVGDRVLNLASVVGSPEGWQCISDGVPGTWAAFGQLGYRMQAGSPINVVTPIFAGEELYDSTNLKWYKSRDLDGSHWQALN